MGRPAKPRSLKLLDGDRPDRINRDEPLPEAVGDLVPAFELSDRARVVWERLAPDLIVKGVLTGWDVDAFSTYCATVATYQDAAEQLALHGMTARGAAGGVIKSPYWQIMRDAVGAMVTLGSRFGLTPSDRAGLKIGGSEDRAQGAERLLG